MDLHIIGFRSISDKLFNFPSESIFLISGASGSGKSTIMNAIYWCLYGNMRNVRNFSSKSSKCSVKITCSNYFIIRSKSPEELKYVTNEIILCDDEAQEKINQLYGSKEMWLSSCYLSQNSRNLFLNGNTDSRLKILSEISFSNEDPSEMINKIESILSEKMKEFTLKNNKLTTEFEYYKKRRISNNIKKSNYLSEKEIIENNDKIMFNIKKLENDLINLEKQKSVFQYLYEKKQNIENNLHNLIFFENVDKTEIEIINNKLEVMKKMKNIEIIIETKESKDILNDDNVKPNLLDIQIISKINFRDEILKNRKKVSQLVNVDGSKEQFLKALEKRNILIMYQPKLELIYNKQKIEDDLEIIKNKIIELETKYKYLYDEEEIEAKKRYIDNYKDILYCPNCSIGLKHIGMELILDKNHKSENIDEIKKIIIISKQYNNLLKEKNRLYEEYEIIEKKCDDQIDWNEVVKYPLLNDLDKKKIEKEINLINDILITFDNELIDENITIENIEKSDKKYKLEEMKKEYEILKERGQDESMEELQEKKKEIEKQIKINIENKCKKNDFEKELNEINAKMKTMDLIRIEEIEQLRNEIEKRKLEKKESEEKLEKWKIIEKFEEERKEFEKTRDYLINLDKTIQNLSYLKHISCEIEHITMNNIIESLNCTINDLLVMIFDQPISVEFNIFKQNKSNSNIKPSISLKILYKGFELDSLNCLSGGEADRVSLAITLALSKFSSSPFILLDEFASGLDVNTKEMVIKSIRSITNNKTIICISHDTVEGIYDYVEKI